MSAAADKVLFEVPYRGEVWRFTLSSFGGAVRLNVRAFWRAENGEWCPSARQSGKGFTMALEPMQLLGEALMTHATGNVPGGPENCS